MTTTLIIMSTALWMWFGAKSYFYWENKRKRISGNMNQTWQKHQVRNMLEFMFYGPGAFLAGWYSFKEEKSNRN